MGEGKKIRILLAKPGLDGHDVGARIVARALLAAGFEVTYTGLRKSPEEIVRRVRDEHFDVLGLSILSGSHLPICRQVRDLLKESGLDDVVWMVGGNIPQKDHEELQAIGVGAVFSVGTPTEAIVDFVRERAS
jgi:methylmalonyl-CoA mutase C-terminal domain/subunit